MLSKERRAYIIQRINEETSLRASTLAKETGASLSTIKRDLVQLEERGFIKRERGGAVSNKFANYLHSANEESVSLKTNYHVEEKRKVAQKAAMEIEDYEIIFIDSGSTTFEMIPYIINRNITIVTNSVFLVKSLPTHQAKVILLGGEYNDKYQMLCSSTTFLELQQLHFDKVFISCNGLHLESEEVYTVDHDNGALKTLVMQRCEKAYLLMDSSKLSVKTAYVFSEVSAFDKVFIDGKNGKIKNSKIIQC